MSQNIPRYAVIGNPIGHSKSPFIHAQFAKQTGITMEYTAERVEIGQLEAFIQQFAEHDGRGLNVTVPFKEDAFQLANHLSQRAQRAGAVNTLSIKEDGLHGDTTDGIGLLNDLIHNHQQNLKNRSILVLGAGGAVRGVLEPLLKESPSQLLIANRTVSRAHQLANDFACSGNISGCGFDELAGRQFDIIINGTSASLSGELPPLPEQLFKPGACAYDMMYAAQATVFMQWAEKQGAENIYDGLGMLVEQAAESFYIWHNIRPQTQNVIQTLRQQL